MQDTTNKSLSRDAPEANTLVANASAPLIDRVRQLIDRGQFNAAMLLLPTLERRGVDPGFVQAMAAGIALARGDRDAAERIIDVVLPDHATNPALLCLRAEIELTEY